VDQFEIRRVTDHDLDAWLGLRNQAFPWATERDRWEFSESLRPKDEPSLRLGAWHQDGTIAATVECNFGEEGERWLDRAESFIMVAPPYRRRGLGTQLAEQAEQFARSHGVRWLDALVYQHDERAARPFLQRRGFRESERYVTSRQDPSTVSLGGLQESRGKLRASGIETVAFSEIDSDAARRSLYECAMEVHHDMPHEDNVDWSDPPYESWIRYLLESPGASADAVWVAREKQKIVGLTYLIELANGNADVGDTGVLGAYRRRGIARTLKLMATQYAQEKGIRRLETENREDNSGMLAINRQLGFVPDQLILIFEKTLKP
jgi:GNAT superfamily N-acetyltransferase